MFERLAWNISLLSEIANSRWAIFLCRVSNRRVQILREVVMVSRQVLTNFLKASRQSPHGYGVASGHCLTGQQQSKKESDEFLLLWHLERQRQLIGKFSDFFNG